MALLSKGSSLISGGIWRLTLARRRRTGRGGGGGVSALQQACAASQPLLAQASFVAACGGGVSAALQQGACAVSSPGRAQPFAAQASLVTGCEALQHVAAGGGSLLPSMLLSLSSLCSASSGLLSVVKSAQRSWDAVKTLPYARFCSNSNLVPQNS